MIPTSSSSHPARKGSRQPAQITGYLAGAVGTAALLSAPQAEAAVAAVTFGGGSLLTIPNVDGTPLNLLGGAGTYGVVGMPYSGVLSLGNVQFLGQGSVYHIAVDSGTPGFAKFFADGTRIGSGGNGTSGQGVFYGGTTYPSLNMASQTGNIAFRTSTNNLGWANVTWDATAKALTINSAFVETDANTPITIVPEPSRALLALAGLGGVALRRRRKQAA